MRLGRRKRGGSRGRPYLDGGAGEPGQLLDMCPLLPDDGTHCLGWDEEIHDLLLRVLGQTRQKTQLQQGFSGQLPPPQHLSCTPWELAVLGVRKLLAFRGNW